MTRAQRFFVFTALLYLVCAGWMILIAPRPQDGHILVELFAALGVGVAALRRYDDEAQESFPLFLGYGFLGAALLDGWHAVGVMGDLAPFLFPHGAPIAFSETSGRLFLSFFLFSAMAFGDAPAAPKPVLAFALASLAGAILLPTMLMPDPTGEEASLAAAIGWAASALLLIGLFLTFFRDAVRSRPLPYVVPAALGVLILSELVLGLLPGSFMYLAFLLKATGYLLFLFFVAFGLRREKEED